jgi:hypothetical protein
MVITLTAEMTNVPMSSASVVSATRQHLEPAPASHSGAGEKTGAYFIVAAEMLNIRLFSVSETRCILHGRYFLSVGGGGGSLPVNFRIRFLMMSA